MLKIIGRTLAFLGILIVVVLASGTVFLATVNPNDYRGDIETIVGEAIGYPLHVRGPINLKLFPLVHFAVTDVLVESPAGFESPLLKLDEATASVSLFSLLKGDLGIGKITLQKPQINLLTDVVGNTNWGRLFADGGGDKKDLAPALIFSDLAVEDANVSWSNLKNQESYSAGPLALDISTNLFDRSVGIDLEAVIVDEQSGIGGEIVTQAEILLDVENKTANLPQFSIEGEVWEDRDKMKLPIQISGDGSYDFNADTLALNSVAAKSDGLQAEADVKIVDLSDKAVVHFDIREGTVVTQSLPDFPELKNQVLPEKITVSGDGSYDFNADTLALNSVAAKSDGLEAEADVKIVGLSDKAVVHFDVREGTVVTQSLPDFPELEKQSLPEKITIAAAGVLDFARELIQFDRFSVNADDTAVSGSGSVATFTETPKINAKLKVNIDTVALDETEEKSGSADASVAGAASSADSASAQGEEQASWLSAFLTPLFTDYQMDIHTDLSIKRLLLEDLELADLNPVVRIKDRSVTMETPEVALLDGSFAGSAAGRLLPSDNIEWRTSGRLNQLDVKKLLSVLDGKQTETFHGKATVDYRLAAIGDTNIEIKRSLKGDMNLSIKEGRFLSSALGGVLAEAIAFLRKRPVSEDDDILRVDSLQTNIVFTGGTAVNRDIEIQTPLLYITGSGKMNLISSALDYRLNLELTKDKSDDDAVQVPLIVSGTFDEPRYTLDLPSLAEREVKKAITKEVTEQLDKVGKVLNEELDKVFKRLKLPF